MKSIKILSTLLLMLLSASIHADDRLRLTNETITDFGKQVEVTTYAKGSSTEFERQVISKYNHAGSMLERTTYSWESQKGWQPMQKLEYQYHNEEGFVDVIFTRWNRQLEDWDSKSETSRYVVADDGSLVVMPDQPRKTK